MPGSASLGVWSNAQGNSIDREKMLFTHVAVGESPNRPVLRFSAATGSDPVSKIAL
jgi:hypothetical protein